MGNEKIQHSLYVGFDMSLHSVCVKIDGSPQKSIGSNFLLGYIYLYYLFNLSGTFSVNSVFISVFFLKV